MMVNKDLDLFNNIAIGLRSFQTSSICFWNIVNFFHKVLYVTYIIHVSLVSCVFNIFAGGGGLLLKKLKMMFFLTHIVQLSIQYIVTNNMYILCACCISYGSDAGIGKYVTLKSNHCTVWWTILNEYIYVVVQAPEGETQPSTEVDLFISTEKIMVLNTDLKASYFKNSNEKTKVKSNYVLLICFCERL